MIYVITFEMPSSHCLDKSGQESTVNLDAAMKFPNEDEAFRYLEEHRAQIEEIGQGAIPSKNAE